MYRDEFNLSTCPDTCHVSFFKQLKNNKLYQAVQAATVLIVGLYESAEETVIPLTFIMSASSTSSFAMLLQLLLLLFKAICSSSTSPALVQCTHFFVSTLSDPAAHPKPAIDYNNSEARQKLKISSCRAYEVLQIAVVLPAFFFKIGKSVDRIWIKQQSDFL